MFDLQFLIVALLIAGAAAYAAVIFLRKSSAFSKKSNCAGDCGCSSKSKNA
jgi:hypothetical protein